MTPERMYNCNKIKCDIQTLLAWGLEKVKWITKINGEQETHGEKGGKGTTLIGDVTVADFHLRQRSRLTPELPPATTLI